MKNFALYRGDSKASSPFLFNSRRIHLSLPRLVQLAGTYIIDRNHHSFFMRPSHLVCKLLGHMEKFGGGLGSILFKQSQSYDGIVVKKKSE